MIDHTVRQHDLGTRQIIFDNIIRENEGKGLDIGCANRPIVDNCETLDYGAEYNPTYLRNATDTKLPDESYDWITALHILEHIDNTIDTLKEWKRILKTDGRIGIVAPHGEGVDAIDLGDSSRTHRTLFTEKILGLFLEHVDFKILELKTIPRPLAYRENPAILAICTKEKPKDLNSQLSTN